MPEKKACTRFVQTSKVVSLFDEERDTTWIFDHRSIPLHTRPNLFKTSVYCTPDYRANYKPRNESDGLCNYRPKYKPANGCKAFHQSPEKTPELIKDKFLKSASFESEDHRKKTQI